MALKKYLNKDTWKAIASGVLALGAAKLLWNILDLMTQNWGLQENLYALGGIAVVMAVLFNKILFK